MFRVLHLEVKLKQAKLDWRIFNLEFHKNCKNNISKGRLPIGKLLQLFIEYEEHAIMKQQVCIKGYTNITNEQVILT